MTKRLDCIVDGCHETFEGDTEEEVMGKAAEHAQNAHPDIDLDDEMMQSIRTNIRDV